MLQLNREAIRDIMAARNLSIRRMATELSIPYTTLNYWLTGQRNPPPDAVYRIALHLGLSMEDIGTIVYDPAEPAPDTRLETVIHLWRYLPDSDRTRISDDVQAVADRVRDAERE